MFTMNESITVAEGFGRLLAAVGHGGRHGARGRAHLCVQIRHHQRLEGGGRGLENGRESIIMVLIRKHTF